TRRRRRRNQSRYVCPRFHCLHARIIIGSRPVLTINSSHPHRWVVLSEDPMASNDVGQLKTVEEPSTPPQIRPTRVRYQVLAAGCSVAVVAYIHRVGFATATTEIKSDLCLTSQDIGFLMTAFLLAYGGFEVPGGLLSDRFGVRHLLTIL